MANFKDLIDDEFFNEYTIYPLEREIEKQKRMTERITGTPVEKEMAENIKKLENLNKMKEFGVSVFEKAGIELYKDVQLSHFQVNDKDGNYHDMIRVSTTALTHNELGEPTLLTYRADISANNDGTYGLNISCGKIGNENAWRLIGRDEPENIPSLNLNENFFKQMEADFDEYKNSVKSGERFNKSYSRSADQFINEKKTENVFEENKYNFKDKTELDRTYEEFMYRYKDDEQESKYFESMKDYAVGVLEKTGIDPESINVSYVKYFDNELKEHDIIRACANIPFTNEEGKTDYLGYHVDISTNDDGTYGLEVYTGNSYNDSEWNIIGNHEPEKLSELELNENFFKQIKADFNEYKNAIESGEQYNKSFSHPIDQYTKKQDIEKSFEDESIEMPITPNQKPDEPDMNNMSIEEIKRMAYVQGVCEAVKAIRAESAVLGSKLLKEMGVTQDDIRKYTKPEVQQEIIPQQKMEQTRTNSFKF